LGLYYSVLLIQPFTEGGGGVVVLEFEEFDEVGDVAEGAGTANFGDGLLAGHKHNARLVQTLRDNPLMG
jgi:hypothetical protein